MMKKLLVLSLSLVLSASIIAGPLDTFYIKLNKITKDLKDTTISPNEAAKQIHAAREELYKMGGLAFKKSPQLKERIDQIKKDNPVFAKELEKIEAAIKKEREERRAGTRKPAPAPTPTSLPVIAPSTTPTPTVPLSIESATKAVEDAYAEVKKILPANLKSIGAIWGNKYYIEKELIEGIYAEKSDYIKNFYRTKGWNLENNLEKMNNALAKYHAAIEVYENLAKTKKEIKFLSAHKKNYNFYPLAINEALLLAFPDKKDKNVLQHMIHNINTLFTDADNSIIPGNGSEDFVDDLGYVVKKTKTNLIEEATEAREEFVDAK